MRLSINALTTRTLFRAEMRGIKDVVGDALQNHAVVMPPVVLTEMLSDRSASATAGALTALPLLEVTEGYWLRAGILRGRVIAGGHKAKIADALIAQTCLDHDVALISNDRDFRHYVKHGLRLVV